LKHVLHNIQNYKKAVEECHRVLKTGGKLVVAVNGRKTMLALRQLRPVIARLLNKKFYIDSDLYINIENIDKHLQPTFKKIKKIKFKSLVCLKNSQPYLDHLDSGKDFWEVNDTQWHKIMIFSKKHFNEILRRKGAIKDDVIVGLALAQKS
jgi:ubiquinone/menaquinone biosynthesis C-methylase UbiE